MKQSGRKSLHRLKIDDTYEHHFFGISCPEPDYKVSLQLNKALNINLRSSSPVSFNNDSNTRFERFVYNEDYSEKSYQLVKNRTENKSLSRNYESLDYFFLVCGNIENDLISDIRKKILEIPMITGVFSLEKDKMHAIYSILQIN